MLRTGPFQSLELRVVYVGVCLRGNKTLKTFIVDFCDHGIFLLFPHFLVLIAEISSYIYSLQSSSSYLYFRRHDSVGFGIKL